METKIIIAPAVVIGNVSLVTIARTSSGHFDCGHGHAFLGATEPVYVVATSGRTRTAYDMSGQPVPFDTFLEEYPEARAAFQP